MWFFWVIWIAGVLMVLTYGAVLMFGAPYFPTLKQPVEEGLDLLGLKSGQVVYDLGCGDGRLLKAAAKRGLRAVGYELNPFVFLYAWFTTLRYGRQVKVRFGNFWSKDLAKADGVFVFLITHFMDRLDTKLASELRPGTLVVSHAFKLPGRKVVRKKGAMLLYEF